MRFSFTPLHSVLALLVATALVLLAGVMLFTSAEQERERTVDGVEVAAAASGVAAALEPGADAVAILDEVVRRENLGGAVLLNPIGRVVAKSAGRDLDGIDWGAAFTPQAEQRDGDQLVRRSWQDEVYWMATSPTVDGYRVVLLRSATSEQTPIGWVLGIAGLIWGLIAAVAFLVLRISQRPADALEALARDLAKSDDMSSIEFVQKRADANAVLGARAKPVLDLASDLIATRRRANDAQTLANAFLQVGPHYVLLCTLGGKILDANPAFFARTKMMPEWLRDQPLDVLEEILPMKPLMELAKRSKEENAALSGVPYALNLEGKRRAVDVALRTFPTSEGDTVLIILTDLTKERTLEHQIDQYTDALDLMVDQRVAELTAGHDDLDTLLDAAGVVFATFDREGETKRFSAEAERLTGRTAFTVRRFEHLAQLLFPDIADREAFTAWFAGGSEDTVRLSIPSPRGPRSLVWIRGERRQAGEVVQRVLLGVEHIPARQHAETPAAAFHATPLDLPHPDDVPNAPGGDGFALHPEERSASHL